MRLTGGGAAKIIRAMNDLVEILTLHSVGARNGVPFSPRSVPLPIFEAFAEELKAFVIGGKGSKEERANLEQALEVSQEDGSWIVGIWVVAALLSSAPIKSLQADLQLIQERRFDEIADASRARAFRKIRSTMVQQGVTRLEVQSERLNITATNILPMPGDPMPAQETWVKTERFFVANPKVQVQLELEGGKTVKTDDSVQGFGTLRATVPEGPVYVRVAFQLNPETGERKDERVLEIVRKRTVFDEAAFDAMASKPNGWHDVADPVTEIRKMRDGNA